SDGRSRTNVAPQALFLMNSQFVVDRSRGFAKRLLANSDSTDSDRVRLAYEMALGRQPDNTELDSALTYVAGLQQRLGETDPTAAWSSFCHVLVAANEFLYLE
ncbi:MAG TPA: DUF1553 domain-containing protein, partial [Bryobacteraceae bacterium]|nr:DUF1553 domain-containing protein [Bryobacteraceae bacterium]